MKAGHLYAGLLVLLGAGAFWDGLYAPAQHLLVTAALAAALLLVREEPGASGRAPAVSLDEAIALALFAAAVLLSLVRPSAAGVAAHGPAVAAGWLLAFRLGRTGSERLAGGLARLWFWLGPLMAFGGLAAFSYLPPHHSGRLAAFLGYPVALGVLGMLGMAGGAAAARGIHPALAGLLWFGNGLAVLLSGSRGVWAACIVLALLLWRRGGLNGLRRAEQMALAPLAAALWAGPAVVGGQAEVAWIAVLSIGLTLILANSFQQRWVRPLADVAFGAAALLAPGWGWLLGRTALPLTEGSSVERLTFLRDGWKMMAEHPLGAGYRAWASLHLQGASYGYYSAEAHSALIDIGLAFGWAGAAAFLWLLGRMVWQTARPPAPNGEVAVPGAALPAVLAGLSALGIHALIDWDLSYSLFAVPLWLGFGLAGPGRWGLPFRLPTAAVRALAGLTLALCAVLGTGDLSIWLGERALHRAEAPAALRYGRLASGVNPWNDAAHALRGRALSALGQAEPALAAIGRARQLNPREPWYAELQARELAGAGPGRWREAGAAYRESVRLWPWHLPAYESALDHLMDLTLRASLLGDENLAADLRRYGRAILEQLEETKAREPAATPRKPLDLNSPALTRLRSFFETQP